MLSKLSEVKEFINIVDEFWDKNNPRKILLIRFLLYIEYRSQICQQLHDIIVKIRKKYQKDESWDVELWKKFLEEFKKCEEANKVSLEMPSLIERGKRYLTERKKWADAGKPMRSQERINEIYDSFCKDCVYRQKYKYCCEICSCFINRGTAFNKIAFATTRCPLEEIGEQPKWIEEPGFQPAPPPKTSGCGCGH